MKKIIHISANQLSLIQEVKQTGNQLFDYSINQLFR